MTPPHIHTPAYETAKTLIRNGVSLLPVHCGGDRDKHPDSSLLPAVSDPATGESKPSWSPFRAALPTLADIDHWYGGSALRGIGLIGGEISGNLVIIDFDKVGQYEELLALAAECSPEIHAAILTMPLATTATPGRRHLYTKVNQPVGGNTKLASTKDPETGKPSVLIETRGEGGYAICPGGDARRRWIRGGPDTIPTVSGGVYASLLALCRVFDQMPPDEAQKFAPKSFPAKMPSDGRKRAGDDFKERGDYETLLERHGWMRLHETGDRTLWRRPGKSHGVSATTGFNGRGLYVFSSNAAPFQSEKWYDPFAVYGLLEQNGDFSAAAKSLGADGYGDPLPPRTNKKSAMNHCKSEGEDEDETEALPRIMQELREQVAGLPVDVRSVGLTVAEAATTADLIRISAGIYRTNTVSNTCLNFAIGDFFNQLPGRHGARASFVRSHFGGEATYQKYRNCGPVAGRWPEDLRRENIPWQFYLKTAALPLDEKRELIALHDEGKRPPLAEVAPRRQPKTPALPPHLLDLVQLAYQVGGHDQLQAALESFIHVTRVESQVPICNDSLQIRDADPTPASRTAVTDEDESAWEADDAEAPPENAAADLLCYKKLRTQITQQISPTPPRPEVARPTRPHYDRLTEIDPVLLDRIDKDKTWPQAWDRYQTNQFGSVGVVNIADPLLPLVRARWESLHPNTNRQNTANGGRERQTAALVR